MSDDAMIRRANLRRLCEARQWGATELSQRIGGRYTYWADMLRGDKGFGERAARKIEEAAGLPRGWLDLVDAPLHSVNEPGRAYRATHWPFSEDVYEALQRGGESAVLRCERVLRALLDLPAK